MIRFSLISGAVLIALIFTRAQVETLRIKKEKSNIEGYWFHEYSRYGSNGSTIKYSNELKIQFLNDGNFNITQKGKLTNYGTWKIKYGKTLCLRYQKSKQNGSISSIQYEPIEYNTSPDTVTIETLTDSTMIINSINLRYGELKDFYKRISK